MWGNGKYGTHKNFTLIATLEFLLEIFNANAFEDRFGKLLSLLCHLYLLKPVRYFWDFLLTICWFTYFGEG